MTRVDRGKGFDRLNRGFGKAGENRARRARLVWLIEGNSEEQHRKDAQGETGPNVLVHSSALRSRVTSCAFKLMYQNLSAEVRSGLESLPFDVPVLSKLFTRK